MNGTASLCDKNIIPYLPTKVSVHLAVHTDHTILKSYFEWQAINQHKDIVYIIQSVLPMKKTMYQISHVASSRDVQKCCALLLGMSEFNGSIYSLVKWLPTKTH